MKLSLSRCLPLAALLLTTHAAAQQRPDPDARLASQRKAMAALSFMDGAWRGAGWTITPDGKRHLLTQTERVGALLDGTVKLVEGRGYGADGRTMFNALGVISYDPGKAAYSIKSYAMGFTGDFPITPTGTGWVWQTPAGPGAVIRYTADFKSGSWQEVGERIAPGAPPVRVFEMRLTRLGGTAWPGGAPVPATAKGK